jgi:hypothetical protein
MPPKLTANDITACFAVTLKTLEVLADNLNTPFLGVISTTIQSLLDNIGVGPPKQHVITVDLTFHTRPSNKTKMNVPC